MSCFALRKGKCNILNVQKCDGSSCSFYKIEALVKTERKQSFERIKTLDKETQKSISESYYGGRMPWIKGGV